MMLSICLVACMVYVDIAITKPLRLRVMRLISNIIFGGVMTVLAY